MSEDWKEAQESIKVKFHLNALTVEDLDTTHLSVLIRRQRIRLKNQRKPYQRTGRKGRDSIENHFMLSKIAKEMWDTLENVHEGDKKVKTTKLQVYRAQFENIKMNDDEDIASFFLRVVEIVNNMKALGETIK